jgi:hypothetical protein
MIAWLLGKVLSPEASLPEPVPSGVSVYRSRVIPVLGGLLSGMKSPAAAVTLGDAILVHPDVRLTTNLLRHELAHVRQWRERPLTFPLHYVLEHLRHGYRQNPYEVEARAAEQHPNRSGT